MNNPLQRARDTRVVRVLIVGGLIAITGLNLHPATNLLPERVSSAYHSVSFQDGGALHELARGRTARQRYDFYVLLRTQGRGGTLTVFPGNFIIERRVTSFSGMDMVADDTYDPDIDAAQFSRLESIPHVADVYQNDTPYMIIETDDSGAVDYRVMRHGDTLIAAPEQLLVDIGVNW